MEFTCKTVYDRKTLTAMSRALRKTLRKKIDRGLKIFSGVVMLIALITILNPAESLWVRSLYGVLVFLMLFVQWKGDALNAIFARGKNMPGMEVCRTRFTPDWYETAATGVVTRWQYDKILAMAETGRYLILILGKNHAQALEKRCLEPDGMESFRAFLQEKTGRQIQFIGR